ncbi:MAG: helix-turn-helix transcriptional regulator [Thermoguttaceae bacterium]
MSLQTLERETTTDCDYIAILSPGEIIAEKINEMGIDVNELAQQCHLPVDTLEKLLRGEIPLTWKIAELLEKVTWMSAEGMMRVEERFRKNMALHQANPSFPVVFCDTFLTR